MQTKRYYELGALFIKKIHKYSYSYPPKFSRGVQYRWIADIDVRSRGIQVYVKKFRIADDRYYDNLERCVDSAREVLMSLHIRIPKKTTESRFL